MKALRAEPLIWTLLCVGVGVVYAQTLGFEFVSADDSTYIEANPNVRGGLSLDNVWWALSNAHFSNWIPLTLISFMVDCSLFGVDPGPIHGVNAALHAAASCLLFSALLRLARAERPGTVGEATRTDPFWPSAVVAALFAFHPAHVESVAWVAERKDVLSGFFWMLTLLAYAAYVSRPQRAPAHYALVLAAFILGLLSKPMVVTLPFVLLLLDVWPLRRIDLDALETSTARRLLVEKLPLLALSAAAAAIAFSVQQHSGALQNLEAISLSERMANVPISYVRYLWLLLWPTDLGFLYPRLSAAQISVLPVAAASILLAALTVATIALRRVAPYLLVGWLWFVGVLVPVIGWVQVGEQSLADRYTYLPSIGLFIGLSFCAATLWPRGRLPRSLLGAASLSVLIMCIAAAREQASTWRNSISLWSRAVAVTRDNATAHDQLGVAYFKKGKTDEALTHHQRAVELRPGSTRNRSNLGNVLLAMGRFPAAQAEFQRVLDVSPDSPVALYGMATCLHRLGDFAGTLDHYESLLVSVPTLIEREPIRRVYATALRAYRRSPGNHFDAAVERYRRALLLDPDWDSVATEMVWALATDPRATRANAEQALAITERESGPFSSSNPTNPMLRARGAALAAAGRFEEAVATMERALDRARAMENDEEIREFQALMTGYRSRKRYVEKLRPR